MSQKIDVGKYKFICVDCERPCSGDLTRIDPRRLNLALCTSCYSGSSVSRKPEPIDATDIKASEDGISRQIGDRKVYFNNCFLCGRVFSTKSKEKKVCIKCDEDKTLLEEYNAPPPEIKSDDPLDTPAYKAVANWIAKAGYVPGGNPWDTENSLKNYEKSLLVNEPEKSKEPEVVKPKSKEYWEELPKINNLEIDNRLDFIKIGIYPEPEFIYRIASSIRENNTIIENMSLELAEVKKANNSISTTYETIHKQVSSDLIQFKEAVKVKETQITSLQANENRLLTKIASLEAQVTTFKKKRKDFIHNVNCECKCKDDTDPKPSIQELIRNNATYQAYTPSKIRTDGEDWVGSGYFPTKDKK